MRTWAGDGFTSGMAGASQQSSVAQELTTVAELQASYGTGMPVSLRMPLATAPTLKQKLSGGAVLLCVFRESPAVQPSQSAQLGVSNNEAQGPLVTVYWTHNAERSVLAQLDRFARGSYSAPAVWMSRYIALRRM